MNACDMALEILRETRDGDALAPDHLRLVENAVNGFLTEKGVEKFRELHGEVVSGKYKKPGFHGIEHLTVDHEGFVSWKGIHVEHYDFPFAFSERGKRAALELAERCKHLEKKGVSVNTTTAIWSWDQYKH